MRFISSLKVYELAKELNLPAKKLILEIRKAGISVEGVFSLLSPEEVELVREIPNAVLKKPHKNKESNPLISSVRESEVLDSPINTETNKNHDQTERKIDLQKIFELSRKNVEKKVKNEFESTENKNGYLNQLYKSRKYIFLE